MKEKESTPIHVWKQKCINEKIERGTNLCSRSGLKEKETELKERKRMSRHVQYIEEKKGKEGQKEGDANDYRTGMQFLEEGRKGRVLHCKKAAKHADNDDHTREKEKKHQSICFQPPCL
mmetsp:Transcript_29955/g.58778  ORF Transcript_29955/g.58778 Transcript_29955/m.58778 type:complete len:119 (-) Transcript_29955:70-426(-)